MSRIAGIRADDPRLARASLPSMLEFLRLAGEWGATALASGGAALGWTGRSAANAVEAHGVLVVMDGHIYNRAELGATASDAELVGSLYARLGFADALRRLNGDFAVALYDPGSDTLWLARDRLGVKPLYYARREGWFAFASQPRALLRLPGVSCEVDRRYVALFAATHYRYFDNDLGRSPYQDIAQLPARHLLRVTPRGATSSAYWSLEKLPDHAGSAEQLAAEYRELLRDAVALRLAVAHRPAFTVSGGMDSSSVLATAVRESGARQNVYSAVYSDRTYDESREIEPMARHAAERWHPVAVGRPDVFGLVRRMLRAHDEPAATATWLSHFLLCEEVSRDGFGALFGGLVGDELNAGEYEHFLYHFADLRAAGRRAELDLEIALWARYHDHPVFQKSPAVAESELARLVDPMQLGRCLPDSRRLLRYVDALDPEYFDLREFEPVMDHPFASYLKNRTYQDLFRETIPCCLRAEDRQASAFGLDHFLPFADHRLVEFMFRVPGDLKIRDGVAKFLLREAMRGVLPEETRTRVTKTGWNAPAHRWFSGPGAAPLLDLVSSRAFRERGIYRHDEVVRLIREHDDLVSSGRPAENHMMFLWQLVNLELWLADLGSSGGERTPDAFRGRGADPTVKGER